MIWLRAPVCGALVVVAWVSAQARQPAVQPVAAVISARKSHCLFIGDSLVPQLALGVRRVDGEDVDVLELRQSPDAAAPIVHDAPLFRPFFVADSRGDGAGGRWHLVQDGYTAEAPLGWARERHLHLVESRYAYTFATRERPERADLHDVSKEAYERLLSQINGAVDGGGDKVVVIERPGAENWRPVTIDDTVPFVELTIPAENRDREYPDTTPTFRFGIPVENRLVHMGAICGGPVDQVRLAQLKAKVITESGLEMLFVVDETTSMSPFTKEVAAFIENAGRLTLNRPVPVRIAVWAYTDGPPGARVTPGAFKAVKGPDDVRELAATVVTLGRHQPPKGFSNPPERMLEGLRDALEHGNFNAGSTLFVAVVGDMGHEPTDPDKEALLQDVADRIKQTGARVYFMHVGLPGPAEESDETKGFRRLFREDAEAVRKAGQARGISEDQVVYQVATANDLQMALENARDAVEQERRRLQMQIRRMESRTPYTAPGPKLLAALEARGIDRGKFEERHVQYFVPSRGWLFHPTSRDTATAQPQLRELFFLAPPERDAVRQLFERLRETLSRGTPIDGEAIVEKFAQDLATAAGNAVLEGRVREVWNRIPPHQRSIGVFMEDAFGLRLKAALPFPAIAYRKEQPATGQEITRMLERIGRLGEAFRGHGENAFWFDASSLVP